MAIKIEGNNLSIEDVVKVARYNEMIEIPDFSQIIEDQLSRVEAMKKVAKCREIVERKIKERAIMYGVTTGIGELAEVVLTPEQTEEYQRYLVYSHAAGYGEPVAVEDVRASILSRINVLVHGHSGCRPVIVETMKEMLNKGVTPVMCQKGSVGASGDLSPMGQMALVLIGEGEAFFNGKGRYTDYKI